MKNTLISQFVDDELNLDEKIEFVETIHDDSAYKEQTVELLHLEKWMRAAEVNLVPEVRIPVRRKRIRSLFRPLNFLGAGLATAAAAVVLLLVWMQQPAAEQPYRFVLFQPDVEQVDIVGSFTGWRAIPMHRKGFNGYWEATLELPVGEHRFNYVIEGGRRIPDPTILVQEKDDFGGVNSIIEIRQVV